MSVRLAPPHWTSPSRPFTCLRCFLKLRGSGQQRWISRNRLAKEASAEEQWAEKAEKIKEGKQQSFLSLLEERGLIHSVVGERDALDHLMTQRRVGAYVGVDPTAPSLHVGHMVALMPLFWMYAHGFKAFTLLGGSTAGIGDPTGRTTARDIMSPAVRKANMAEMHMQLKKLWISAEHYINRRGYEYGWAWRRGLANNNLWWNKKPLLDVMRDLGSGVRIGPMLGRDNVKTRLESGEGMSFAEFAYPLMQCWDWWELYQQQGIQIQIGGSDQYGNILSGIEGIKHMNKTHHDPVIRQDKPNPLHEPMGITVPLLTTPSGEKFGKSAGNAIWLAHDMTCTFDLYQYFVRQPDSEVERLLKLFTFIPIPDITSIMKSHVESPEKRLAQHTLAREFVELVHGKNAADDAEAQHRVAFSGKLPLPPAESSSKKEQPTTAFTMPSHHVTLPRSLITTQALSRVLVSAGLTKSRSESHQLMTNNGVSIGSRSNKSEMGDDLTFSPLTNWTADKNVNYIIDNSLIIIRVGKWKLKIIKVVSDEEFEKLGLEIPDWPLAAPEKTWQEKPKEVEVQERLERFNAHNLKQRLERLETFKEEGVVGPGMSARHMKQRLSFKKHEAKKKRKLERLNGGFEEEEELTEAEKEEIKRKEAEFWKDVKL